LAKKVQCRFDDLLAKAGFFTFTKSGFWFIPRLRILASLFFYLVVVNGHRRCGPPHGDIYTAHKTFPPE